MNPVEPHVSQLRIRELFDYSPDTGDLCRKRTGYIYQSSTVWVDGRTYEIGRVIWCWMYGWPPAHLYIDHINNIHGDNKLANLRLASPKQNALNQGQRGSYPKGVSYRSDMINKPWLARITVGNERIHLGFFATMEEAALAYRDACIRYHGEFACYD